MYKYLLGFIIFIIFVISLTQSSHKHAHMLCGKK